jgi:hypothetical protein
MITSRRIPQALLVTVVLLLGWGWAPAAQSESVVILRVPDGGRLPQALIDDAGTVHLVYYQGEAWSGGDLFYVTRQPGASTWSAPQRVNSEPSTVAGIGPVDGGQMTLGRQDRLHVAWFQMSPTRFFYTRANQEGTGFEPQFGVATGDAVETGPSIAADSSGNVFLFWHAGAVEDAQRSVYMVVSRDDGTTFEPARQVNAEGEGVCNCCRLRALSNDAGTVYLSYRGAGDNVRRGQRLLTSSDAGQTFTDELIHPWELNACPVSTTTLSQGSTGMTVAWETQGQVYFAGVDRLETPVSPPGKAETRRKNPAVAVNHRGETLLVWGDGPGLRSGGALHWHVFDADGQPTSKPSHGTESIPDGSVPTALARADGTFLVIF